MSRCNCVDTTGGLKQGCSEYETCRKMFRIPERDPLLQERQSTHGSFEHNAVISQSLKATFAYHIGDNTDGLYSKVHRESLDMIALKLSRILSGQPNFKDHWDDIAGYAKLASEACK